MRSILVLVLLSLSSVLFAKDKDYSVYNIPVKLLKGANAVIRNDIRIIELKSLDKMIIKEHRVITILNEKGDRFAGLVEAYDQFHIISSIEGNLFNAAGQKIKTLKKNDLQDFSNVSDISLAEDGRIKVHNFYHKVYPYTVEYIVETMQKQTMFFPQWHPVPSELVSVEHSQINIQVPSDYKLRYISFNYKENPVITPMNKQIEYSWKLENFEAIVYEVFSPDNKEITPVVMMAPSEFIIEDYKGKMNDWKELGFFQASLNKDRDVLPEEIKKKVQDLVKNAGSEKEKIERLYNFLQKNTRYISIQLGVGGWRPFDATYVATKGYGDCKALSNYMFSLLKQAGIPSHYTLIKAGKYENDIVKDFPSRQFNHVILCVPNNNDTIWLECTSQITPAGYMGAFTGNRHALLITDEGGKLVRTPKYGAEENLQIRTIKAVLEENGTLSTNIHTRYTGIQQDDLHGRINALSKEKVKEVLVEQFDFSTYDVNKFEYKEHKSALPSIDESLDITVSNYATITGRRLFILPNIMTRSFRKLTTDTTRKYDIQLGYEYRDIDSVEIELPEGYALETMPKDVIINSKFGNYSSSVKLKDNKLFYFRSIEQNSGRFPAKEYNDLVKFYSDIYKADRNRVVLVKNEEPKKAF